MTEAQSILIELIGNVLCDKPTSFDSLSDQKLKEVYALAKRHDLSHFIGAALSKKKINVSDTAFQHYQNILFETSAKNFPGGERLQYFLSRNTPPFQKY